MLYLNMKPFLTCLLLVLIGALFAGCSSPRLSEKPVRVSLDVTGKGEILLELYPAKAPQTCQQIVRLVKEGFYNGQKIHRVEDWVIQWGDPQTKRLPPNDPRIGSGGSGNPLPFEETDVPMVRGVVAMASVAEKEGGDSQIFILKKDASWLQGNYCGFGKVISGMDIVDKLEPLDEIREMRIMEN